MADHQVAIIGGGITGLTAAHYLQKANIDFILLEAQDQLGGRVQSTKVDEFIIDRGFQVFLTAYPEAKAILDYEKLGLSYFDPGAMILKDSGDREILGDPLRQWKYFIPTLRSSSTTFRDKLKILNLRRRVQQRSINSIFKNDERTTLEYLQQFGFSKTIMQEFFTPFFSGIFLEPSLDTSSRMFEFVFKMFTEGFASLPQNGIQAIPQQLASGLAKGNIRLNSKVKSVKKGTIHIEHGDSITADKIIVSSPTNTVGLDFWGEDPKMQSTVSLHFTTEEEIPTKKLIALNHLENKLVNNICCMSNVQNSYSQGKPLINASIIGNYSTERIDQQAKTELARWFPSAPQWQTVDVTKVELALPAQKHVQADQVISEHEDIVFAGDFLSYGALNGAMKSGRTAAQHCIKHFQT